MAKIFGIKTVKAVMIGEDKCPNKACGYGEYFWEELDYQGDDEVQIEQDAWQKVKKCLEDCDYEYKEIEEEYFDENKDNEGDYAWYIGEERREVGYKVREVVLDPKSIDVIRQAMEEQGLSMTDDCDNIVVGEDTYVLWRPELGDMKEVFYRY